MTRPRPCILFLHSSNELYGADRSLLWLVLAVLDVARPIVALPDDLPYGGALAERLREERVEVRVGRVPVLRRGYLRPLAFPGWAVRALWDTVALTMLARKEHVDAVVTNTSGVVIGPIVARMIGRPHIWYVREIVERPRWYRSFLRVAAQAADGIVVAVSSSVADWLGPVPGRGPVVGHNGVDIGPVTLPLPATPTVAFIGRLNAWKGHEVFIAAATMVHRNRGDARFVLVGGPVPGDLTTEHQVREELGRIDPAEAWISLRGEVADVREVMQSAWAIAVPSTRPDPLPNVILEAMAEGRAVLGSRLGGIPEMIDDGVTGRLVDPADSAALAGAMEWILADRERCDRLGRAGYARAAAEFSREALIRRWRATLAQATGSDAFSREDR